MIWDQIAPRWDILKRSAQARWNLLTADDLDLVDGQRLRLVELIRYRYDRTLRDAEAEVDEFASRHAEPPPQGDEGG
jgi:hypothetical protein